MSATPSSSSSTSATRPAKPVHGNSSASQDQAQHHHGGREYHNGHYHEHPRTHQHTVIHAVRSAHPPHHGALSTRKHLVARPRARQYFTLDGDLHRQCDDGIPRQAGKFELFLDLLYVGLVANFAEDMVQHPNGWGVAKYILIFVPVWQIWCDLTAIMNRFYNDDLVQRGLIIWIMALILLYGNNATSIASLPALQVTTASYMLARASILAVQLFYSLTVTHHSFQLRVSAALSLLFLPLYAPLFFPLPPHIKIPLAVLAFVLERSADAATHNRFFHGYFRLPYRPAVDIDHHADRMSAFYTLVLGEFLYGLVWMSPATPGVLSSAVARAVLVLVIAFALCWLYVSCDGSRENHEAGVHALRWRAWTGMGWFVLHLPLSMALLLAGECGSVFVKYGWKGAGTAEAGLVEREEGEAPGVEEWAALRWLFCGGLAVGIVCLYVVSLLHHEVDEDDETKCLLLFPKHMRRIVRLPVAVVIACLPLASPESLSITALLGVVAGVLGFTVLWEMVGSLDRKQWTLVEGGKGAMCAPENLLSDGRSAAVVEGIDEKAESRRNDVGIEVEIFDGVRNVVAAHPGEEEHGMIKCEVEGEHGVTECRQRCLDDCHGGEK